MNTACLTLERDKSLDGIKFLLIVLVVCGHMMEPYRYEYSPNIVGRVYSVIYLFHMPLFIMLSGYFSKNLSLIKIKRTISAIWQPFLLCALLSALLSRDIRPLYVHSSSYWYLFALVIWKLCAFGLNKFQINRSFQLVMSFIMSFLVMSFIGRFSEYFSCMRIVGFFPFFLIGSYVNEKTLKTIKSKKLLWIGLGVVIMFVAALLSSRYLHILEFHRDGVSQIAITFDKSNMMILVDTIVLYCASLIVCLSVICVPPLQAMEKLGSHTLLFYVLQEVVHKSIGGLCVDLWWLRILYIIMIFGVGIYLIQIKWDQYILSPFSSIFRILK